jgi:glyoxylase-like metal-dependent hydrolase (beta-lactamase superfamily II)|tara:strand:+ start:172 stop:813 length:642 start_codon:yes stop_codon:yes gene_type:complete
MKETIIPVTGFAQNCTLIWCEETVQGAVIDPGGDIEKILAAVEQHEVMVAKILITHGHIDHAGGAAALAEKLGCPIEGPHKEDAFLVTDLVQQGAQFGLVDVQNFEPTRWFDQGDTVSFGNITLDVIHCPGHTPGHVVFFHKDENIAIVGDVLFQGSIGRTDFPGGDHPTLIRSIKERLWPLGNDVTFIPGHGPHSTFGIERQTNPFVGDHAV